jgi:hypothetical protein
MTSEWVAAYAAVAAAIVGPLATVFAVSRQNRNAAVIARRQINATVISASRQAWIDTLRDSIANFQATLYQVGFRGTHSYDRAENDTKMQVAIQLHARIALLIHPSEPDHKELLLLIQKALSVAYTVGEDGRREMAIVQAAITEKAQSILKREWERVKAGEPDETTLANQLTVVREERIRSPDA